MQSRIALAGYEACHDLSACILAAKLESVDKARVLVAGAGGNAQEVSSIAKLRPEWKFTAVDPSAAMLDLAKERIAELGVTLSVDVVHGYVDDLPREPTFDAATLLGVLHHVSKTQDKLRLLRSIADRLKTGAPLILACNCQPYENQPLLLAAWRQRWLMAGTSESEADSKLAKILAGATPPASEEEVCALLRELGFREITRFFSSLFWVAWIAY
ncbi:MAG: class I SAM-dependent methyltransferase [Acidobacteriota bacterium]|nr:class I SAM-dependent methyltransferase [Acidobacteriota bacterium]